MEQHQLEQAARQRAGLMGLIIGLLKEEKDLDINQVKSKIIHCIGVLIDLDVMVKDEIDLEVAQACKEHLEGQLLIDEVIDLLK